MIVPYNAREKNNAYNETPTPLETIMTKLEIAKLTVRTMVGLAASRVIENTLANATTLDPDGIPVRATGIVGGAVVADKLGPTTDALVDRYASRLNDIKSDAPNQYQSNR